MHQGWVCQAAQMGWCACQGKIMRARRCSRPTFKEAIGNSIDSNAAGWRWLRRQHATVEPAWLHCGACTARRAGSAAHGENAGANALHGHHRRQEDGLRWGCGTARQWLTLSLLTRSNVRATGLTSTSTAVAVATQSQPTKSLVWWCSAGPTLMPDLILRPR